MTTEFRIFLNPESDFEEGRLVKEVQAKEKTNVDFTEEGRLD